jgi:hypothetical protein
LFIAQNDLAQTSKAFMQGRFIYAASLSLIAFMAISSTAVIGNKVSIFILYLAGYFADNGI